MADLLRRPAAVAVGAVVVAVLVAVGVLLARGGDDDSPDPAPSIADGPTSGTAAGDVSSAPSIRASPEEFCQAFRAFADASDLYVANADATTEANLLAAGRTLASLDPLGLSPGGQVALDQLVNGSLDPLDESVELANGGLPDEAAFDAYLTNSCPA